MARTPPAARAAADAVAGDIVAVSGSTSASTGTRPACRTALATPQNVTVGTRTRAPAGRSSARNESSRAAVHDETATASRAPTHAANSCSKATHSGPVVSQPDARERWAAACASGVITARVNAMSSAPIRRTPPAISAEPRAGS